MIHCKKITAYSMGFALISFNLFAGFGNSFAEEEHLINPNVASVEQLAGLKGMNEQLAKNIVILREQMGDFQSPEDLLEAEGMTKELLDKIMPYLTVDAAKADCGC